MNIHQLRSIVELVNNDFNVSATAEKLYTSQPAVSKQIKMLEDELSVSLFERSGKKIKGMTPIGEEIASVAQGVIAQIDQIKEIAASDYGSQSGTLNIATTHTQARYKLPDVISRFNARYPHININLHQGAPAQIAQLVQQGDVDFAIAAESMHLFEDLVTLPCYSWNRGIVVPVDHPLTQKPITFEALAQYPLITYVFGFTGNSKIEKAFKLSGFSPRSLITATDTDVIKHYVRQGLGVGVIASMAFDENDADDLVCLDASHLFESSTIHVCFRKHKYLKNYMYDFIELYCPQLTRSAVQGQVQLSPTLL